MRNLWKKYLTNNYRYNIEDKEYRQVFLINIALLQMVITFFVFTVVNIVNTNWPTFIIDAGGLFITVFLLVFFHCKNRVVFLSYAVVGIVVAILIMYISLTENINNSIFWIMIIPPVSFSLLGMRVGSFVTVFFLTYFIITLNQENLAISNSNFISYLNISAAFIITALEIGYNEYARRETQFYLTKKSKEFEKMAEIDCLTKLVNRGKIDRSFDEEISKEKPKLSIIFADLDMFKNVNDSHGHISGDHVLIEVANIMKNVAGEKDIVGRWGGEEFLIVCPDKGIKQTLELAEIIRKKIAEYVFIDGIRITISIGATEYIEKDTVDTMLKRTDQAMYNSKDRGKNCISHK